MKGKQGAELTMNTIIIAVIALIVLITIVFIFASKIKGSSEKAQESAKEFTTGNCEIPGTGRVCKSATECKATGGIDYGRLDCRLGICCSK